MASSGQVVKGISIDSITDDIQLQEMVCKTIAIILLPLIAINHHL